MRKVTVGVVIFLAGWGLGWFTYHHWGTDPVPFAEPVVPVPSNSVTPEAATVFIPTAPGDDENLAALLQRNDFGAVLERYDSLQVRGDAATATDARSRILSHARQLIESHRFDLAEQLLQGFLVAAYRDVEARILLAEAYRGQQDVIAAIDQLYEARGYAYRPAMLQRITVRIRSLVAEQKQTLKRNGDLAALLALFQHLTQQEPDHAPWFMELAATQLELEDREAARRSLLLVSQDPDVGAQAQALLAETNLALAGMHMQSWDAAPEVAGIPLHRSGNHFIADATPAHGRSIRLLIDTGASLTIFRPEVLEQRGIRYRDTGRTGIFTTANGTVRGPIYLLDSLAVGDWHVDQLEIGVLELDNSFAVDGLLGMNFLNHFQFFIDQNETLLRLSTK